MWGKQPEQRGRARKLLISGPEGAFKTRTALRLCDNQGGEAATALFDLEHGSDHYWPEFNFRIEDEIDPDKVYASAQKLVANPGPIKSVILDSATLYQQGLVEKWIKRYLDRNLTSAGHKKDYYVLQPNDYANIYADMAKIVKVFLGSNLNVVFICQLKDEWSGLKVVGTTFDAWKKLAHYFDTVIEIDKGTSLKEPFKAYVRRKDRTYSFKVGEKIPWQNDKDICKYLATKFGQNFYEWAASLESGNGNGQQKKAESKVEPKAKQEAIPKQEPKTEPKAEQQPAQDPEPAPKEEPKQSAEAKEEKPAENPQSEQRELEASEAAEQPDKPKAEDTSGPASREQLVELVKLKREFNITDPEVWNKLLEPYSVPTAKNLTANQCDDFKKNLVEKFYAKGESSEDDGIPF